MINVIINGRTIELDPKTLEEQEVVETTLIVLVNMAKISIEKFGGDMGYTYYNGVKTYRIYIYEGPGSKEEQERLVRIVNLGLKHMEAL